jgi:hypothetical protein
VGVQPPHSPGWADFSIMMECTLESGHCESSAYNVSIMSHWPLPAVRDLTFDDRLSTYDESVLKLSKVSFREKCARMGYPLKLPSLTKLARLGHFPPVVRRAALPARCSILYYIFSLVSIVK